MQVPLIDVTGRLGPVELRPLRNNLTCKRVRAVSRKGSATIYQHHVMHRGTANVGVRDRIVLDFSFMSRAAGVLNRYGASFHPQARQGMQRLSERFSALCERDGLRCDVADQRAYWPGWDFLFPERGPFPGDAHTRADSRLWRASRGLPELEALSANWFSVLRAREISSRSASYSERVTAARDAFKACLAVQLRTRACETKACQAARVRAAVDACRDEAAAANSAVKAHVSACVSACEDDYELEKAADEEELHALYRAC
eukprot:3347113-Prymnesium_polylepis.1